MTGLVILFSFILGAIVGSFLNVVSFRYNTGRSVGGRSACLSCGAKLSWYELIPVVSFFIQRGCCRSCGAKISWEYPTVELVTGFVFASAAYRELPLLFGGFVWPQLFFICYLLISFSLLIAITSYDLRHKIIPNGLVWTFILISFAKIFIAGVPTALDLLAGPMLALPFVLIWFLSDGRAMGFGDAKLALGLGWMLGLKSGLSMLLLSFWIGGAMGIFLLLRKHGGYTMKSEIPFAPFLVSATFLEFIFQFNFVGITSLLG